MGCRTASLVVLPVALIACTAFDDGVGGGADAGSAPGTTDASAGDGASRPDAPSLVDGTFEQSGTSRCAGVIPFQSTAVPDPIAATGAFACRVCSLPTTEANKAGAIDFAIKPAPAGRYRMRFSARKVPGPTPSVGDVAALFHAYVGAAEIATGPSPVSREVVYPEYRRYEVAWDLPSGADRMEAVIRASDVAGECVLVDDVEVTRD